jgi:hypothetical protein
MIDTIITDTTITALGTLSATLIGVLKWFHGNIQALNVRMDSLSASIAGLDKSLAVQSTILTEALRREKL